MQIFGPYLISPYEQQVSTFQINVLASTNSLVEIANYSPFLLQINFQSGGQLWHGGKSQAIYQLVESSLGTQTITVTAPPLFMTQVAPQSPQLNFLEPAHTSPTRAFAFVNVYAEGEAQWYAPFDLPDLMNQVTDFTSVTPAAGPYTVKVPTTFTRFGYSQRPISYVTGFDLTIDSASASSIGNLVISNLLTQDDGSTTLTYRLRSATVPESQFYTVRFPQPITNDPSTLNQVTFSVPSLGDASIGLNVYYFF